MRRVHSYLRFWNKKKLSIIKELSYGKHSIEAFLVSTGVSNSIPKFMILATRNFAMIYINLWSHFTVFSPLFQSRQDITQELAIITRQWLIVFSMHWPFECGMVCSFQLINVLDCYIKQHKTHTGLTENGVELTPWFNVIRLFKITFKGSCALPAYTFNIWISPQEFLSTLPFPKWCCIFWVDKSLFQTH